ncbi:neural cell adhesion molecule 1 [Notolabrus celidotus]|uniref:neural cell adhesion molecule 1 n=1 Tax=Notolabrus celidotus TaxID=1203425 RepID=UPI00148F96F9|nr:neural cell adhesion molecule 1 [Notolabrus celidotus]
MMNQSAIILSMTSLLLLLAYGTAKMDIITSKQDVPVGHEILLLCKAGGEGDITWQKDHEDVDEEYVLKVDETSSKLTIKKATLQDTGRYTCLCDFESGHSDEIEKSIYVYEGPSFGSTSTYHEFLKGTDGVVPCLGTGQPVVDVLWFRDNQEIPTTGGRVSRLPDNTLQIEEVQRDDAGTYTCQAQIRGRPIYQRLRVSVVVNVQPTAQLKEEVKKVMAGPETNITFLCLVDGHPKPNITWTMPTPFDSSHHQFNSDQSELTVSSVAKEDYGEYICTAKNKIAESIAVIMLHVFEAPEVCVSDELQRVSVGEPVSVSCNVSGHPQPELHWLNKQNGQTLDSTSGRVRVVDGELIIDEMVPSDGGLYSCMAVGTSGNASRDIAITTQPGPPHYLSVAPGPTSVFLFLKTPPISGGAPITSYVLQWRRSAEEKWEEMVTVPALDPLAITSLKPYTLYSVRLAAMNAVGVGQFSDTNIVRTHGIQGEPDSPVLSTDAMKVEGNSFSVPLKQNDDGGTPLQHFSIRYKQVKEGSEWKDMQLSSDAESVSLRDLSFSSNYHLEVIAINANGSSIPTTFNFTIGPQPVSSMTKGSVVAIIILIFLVLFLIVDASCCYINRCGLLMSIAVKVFGQKVPGLRMLEDGDGNTNGEVKLKGISTPRGSLQPTGVPTITKDGGQLTEVTCDKAPLTKHEKSQPRKDLPTADS